LIAPLVLVSSSDRPSVKLISELVVEVMFVDIEDTLFVVNVVVISGKPEETNENEEVVGERVDVVFWA